MDAQTPQQPWEDMLLREPQAPAQPAKPKAVAAPSKPAAPAPQAAPAPAPAPSSARKSSQKVQASYLAHELRAPVTSIRLGLEIFAEQIEGRLQADERQMLSLAIRNTQRLEGLVNDIMDYSKIAAGKLAIVKEACDPRALADDAVEALRATAVAKGVKINREYAPLLPRVAAEGRRVTQVVINLLSNAIKFTPARGQITLSIAEGRYEHQGTLVFKVRDSGCGLAPEDLERVFGMFEQASSGGARVSDGTGLGLTLAKAMVELHGGRIWAESWKGCGATFCFTVPIAPVDMSRPVEVYAEPLKFHGLIADLARRLNAVIALFV